MLNRRISWTRVFLRVPVAPALAVVFMIASSDAAAAQESPGYLALREGRYDEAVGLLERDALGGAAQAWHGWLSALWETGEYEEAVRVALRARESGVAVGSGLLGAALAKLGRIDEARSVLGEGSGDAGEAGALARLELGVLDYCYGDRARAREIFAGFIEYYNRGPRLTRAELVAVGSALNHLSRWSWEYAHDALRVLDEAIARQGGGHAAEIALGELFLERYDAREAAAAFQRVLAMNPSHPDALFGMARVARLEGGGQPVRLLETALKTNPRHVGARTLLARLRLLEGARSEALDQIDRALAVNPSDLDALGTRAAIMRMEGERDGFQAVMDRTRSLSPTPTQPLLVLSELSADRRKYEDALMFAMRATEADSSSWRAWGLLGINQIRLGRVEAGRANLERAFGGDPFNLWFKNTLDLLDTFGEYRTIETPHFRLVLHESEANVLAPYMEPIAERAFAEMSGRYGYAPEGPVRVEVYPRHEDFSVRTVGLVGIGALGVSFGPALAMDSPSARGRGAFNWASTLWHEIAHSFHLGVSQGEVPRWFSEGLAVHEQRKAGPGWGHQAGIGFVQSLAQGTLRPVSELDRGFTSPRHPGEVVQSYYHASLVLELIERRHGFPAIVAMLEAYRDGATDAEAFDRVLGVRLADFDREFLEYLGDRFQTALSSVGGEDPGVAPGSGVAALQARVARQPDRFGPRMALGQALLEEGRQAEAAEHFEAALRLFPRYGGADGAHGQLARIRENQGDVRSAIAHYRAFLELNEGHYEARVSLAGLLAESGDRAGAAEVMRALAHIDPFVVEDRERLAELLVALGDIEGEIIERRAVLALDPVDRAQAHYRLALALDRAGDRAGARSAVLAALELAPNYEAALELLLSLRSEAQPG